MAKKLVYLSLGSNIGDREANLRSAIARLHHTPDFEVKRISAVWETAPMYRTDQPEFLNCVLEAESTLFPMRLLLRAAKIEQDMGRRRAEKNGPRSIDIDIVIFGRFAMNTPQLQVPHPRMAERRFVLEPLAELAPDLRHPVTCQTVREMLAALPAQTLRKTDLILPVPGSLPGQV